MVLPWGAHLEGLPEEGLSRGGLARRFRKFRIIRVARNLRIFRILSARAAPRRDFRRFWVDFRLDFHRFLWFFVADRTFAPRVVFRVNFRSFLRLHWSSESTCSDRADPHESVAGPHFREGWALRARTENRSKFVARALPGRLARTSEN